MRPIALLMLAGCAGSGTAPVTPGSPPTVTTTSTGTTTTTTTTGATTPPEPTYTWACRTDVPADQLHGAYPPSELAAPVFNAANYDGSPRTRDDLQGHVTVMWFYPAASTAG